MNLFNAYDRWREHLTNNLEPKPMRSRRSGGAVIQARRRFLTYTDEVCKLTEDRGGTHRSASSALGK